ncbi:MAG: hypothetical protein QOJ07_3951 [Thermoleophilaceae bacterium]|jgi:hypothetical protein|nr:hypothetical protein [Thermoleophilaceae bacterium]
MDAATVQKLARMNGIGRTAIGATLVLVPGLAGRTWVGSEALGEGTKVFIRALGVRDAALGIGLIAALGNDGPARGWLEGAAMADAVDAAATLIAWRSLPPLGRAAVLAIAAQSAVQCALLARSIDG